jgi:RNA polymerase sigma-70 factor, ECF subfamily
MSKQYKMDTESRSRITLKEEEQFSGLQKEVIFEKIYSKYHSRVCSFLTRKIGNPEDALDLAQEVYMIFYRRMEKLNINHPRLESWLYRVGQNLSYGYNRKKVNRLTNNMGDSDFANEKSDSVVDLQKKEMYSQLNDFLNSLTDRERSIFVLHKIEKIKYNDLMAIFNISPRTLKRMISSVLQKLRSSSVIDQPDFEI